MSVRELHSLHTLFRRTGLSAGTLPSVIRCILTATHKPCSTVTVFLNTERLTVVLTIITYLQAMLENRKILLERGSKHTRWNYITQSRKITQCDQPTKHVRSWCPVSGGLREGLRPRPAQSKTHATNNSTTGHRHTATAGTSGQGLFYTTGA